ncbi:MAG: hypothetical protein ACLFP7_02705 [Thiohalospira sp.]
MAGRRLTLLVPPLFGPVPGLERAAPTELPRLPALGALAARGRPEAGSSPDTFLAALFAEGAGLAALAHLGDTGEADGRFRLFADPVHLTAGHHHLVMDAAGEELELEPEEATELVASLNELHGERGWTFSAPLPHRWYLDLSEPAPVATTPLPAVAGRPVDRGLPVGEAGRTFNAALAETQMALHDHPVNQRRAERGLPPVNSVWFWGEGTAADLRRPRATLWTDHPAARGGARATEADRRDPPVDAEAFLRIAEAGDHVVLLEEGRYAAATAPGAWLEVMQALEATWFAPLLAALQRGRLAEVALIGEAGGVSLTPGRARRIWRRPWPVSRLAAGD